MSVLKTPVTPDPPGIQLGKQVVSEATGQPGQVMLACSKSPSTSGMRPLMVFTLAAGAGAPAPGAPAGASKVSIPSASSANRHPVSVSIRSESSSGCALLTLNPHMTAHTSTTQAVILKLAGDHRIRTMAPRLRLKIQDRNEKAAGSFYPIIRCIVTYVQWPDTAAPIDILSQWPLQR